mgnify:CR=1 FL=1
MHRYRSIQSKFRLASLESFLKFDFFNPFQVFLHFDCSFFFIFIDHVSFQIFSIERIWQSVARNRRAGACDFEIFVFIIMNNGIRRNFIYIDSVILWKIFNFKIVFFKKIKNSTNLFCRKTSTTRTTTCSGEQLVLTPRTAAAFPILDPGPTLSAAIILLALT